MGLKVMKPLREAVPLRFDQTSFFYGDPIYGNRLDGGVSNQSFSFSYQGTSYLYRNFGSGIPWYQEREREKSIWDLASRHGLSPKIVEWSTKSRYSVSEFIHGSPLDKASLIKNDEWIRIWKRLHSLRAPTLLNRFDPFSVIERGLRQLGKAHQQAHPIGELYCKVLQYCRPQNLFVNGNDDVVCHLDIHPLNIMSHRDSETFFLIDWEFAHVAPVTCDLAHMIAHMDWDHQTIQHFVVAYDRSSTLLNDIYRYLPMACLFWALWCILKEEAEGEKKTEYRYWYSFYLERADYFWRRGQGFV